MTNEEILELIKEAKRLDKEGKLHRVGGKVDKRFEEWWEENERFYNSQDGQMSPAEDSWEARQPEIDRLKAELEEAREVVDYYQDEPERAKKQGCCLTGKRARAFNEKYKRGEK